MLIIEKMLIFLVLMLVGLLTAKVHILDEHANRKLSSIVVYIANPAMIIMSSQTEHLIPDRELLTALIIAVIMYAVLITAAAILPRLMKLEQNEANAYALMLVFSNIGFMGIPLVSEILGSSALLYVSVFIILFSVLIYTYGVMLLERNSGASQTASKWSTLKKCINPGVISSILAVTFYLLRIQLPEIITSPLGYLSDLTAPLGMMIIGATLADVKIRSFFTDYKLQLFTVIKMVILPLAGCLLLKLIIGGGDLLGVCVVMMSAPVGSMTVMMAQQYGGDYTLLSKGVTLTTLVCIVTIPLMFTLLL